jgi:hypothetical protein
MRQQVLQDQRLGERTIQAALCLSKTKTLERYRQILLSSLTKLNRWQFVEFLQCLDDVGDFNQVKAALCDGDVQRFGRDL